MAIGKWISFGTSPSSTAAPVVVAAQPPVISSADAKQFGLENVRHSLHSYVLISAHGLLSRSSGTPGEFACRTLAPGFRPRPAGSLCVNKLLPPVLSPY